MPCSNDSGVELAAFHVYRHCQLNPPSSLSPSVCMPRRAYTHERYPSLSLRYIYIYIYTRRSMHAQPHTYIALIWLLSRLSDKHFQAHMWLGGDAEGLDAHNSVIARNQTNLLPNGVQEELLPEQTPHPVLHNFANFVVHRALDPTCKLDPPSEDPLLQRLSRLREDAMPNALHVLRVVNEVLTAQRETDRSLSEIQLLLRKGDEIESFRSAMKEHDAIRQSAAVRLMMDYVERLVYNSSGDSLFDDAMYALRIIRDECLKKAMPNEFNKGFAKLRSRFKDDALKGEFWRRVQNSGIGFITAAEVSSSSLTEQDARKLVEDNGEDPSRKKEEEI